MKIGCITNCLGKIELESFLERFQKAGVGIKYLEVSPETIGSHREMSKEKGEVIRATIERYGMTPAAYCIGGWTSEDREYMEKAFQGAMGLGVDVIVGCARKDILTDIDSLCNKYRVYFALEPHFHHPDFESPQSVYQIFGECSPYIGVNLHGAHFVLAGYDQVEAAELLRERIYHAHFNDLLKGKEEKHELCVVGEGNTRAIDFIRKLVEFGFQRLLSLEYLGGEPDKMIEQLVASREVCERILKEKETRWNIF